MVCHILILWLFHQLILIPPKKVTTPVAKEVQKLKERETSDSEIVEHLFKTDGLMKPATPKNNPIAMSRLNHKNN